MKTSLKIIIGLVVGALFLAFGAREIQARWTYEVQVLGYNACDNVNVPLQGIDVALNCAGGACFRGTPTKPTNSEGRVTFSGEETRDFSCGGCGGEVKVCVFRNDINGNPYPLPPGVSPNGQWEVQTQVWDGWWDGGPHCRQRCHRVNPPESLDAWTDKTCEQRRVCEENKGCWCADDYCVQDTDHCGVHTDGGQDETIYAVFRWHSNECPQERIVGRVVKDGIYQTGLTISSNDGKTASWSSNAGGYYYHIGRWPAGTTVTITLTNPYSNYSCRWTFDSNPGGSGGKTSGNGCSATVTLGSGSYSPDWQNHLWFYLEPKPPTVDIRAARGPARHLEDFSDGPITIPYGSSATLLWTSTYASSCQATSTDGNWSGSKSPQCYPPSPSWGFKRFILSALSAWFPGSRGALPLPPDGGLLPDGGPPPDGGHPPEYFPPPPWCSEERSNLIGPATYTYTLTCTGPGGTATDSVEVNVSGPPLNHPPEARNLEFTEPDYCISDPSGIFSWNFIDLDGDTQSAYHIQVDDNSDFSSPVVNRKEDPSSSTSTAVQPGTLEYDKTYYWRLMVWDSQGASSDWIYPDPRYFSTPHHRYPRPDFEWSPQDPVINQEIRFSSDRTTCYDSCLDDDYDWNFGDGSTSIGKNPTHSYSSPEWYTVTLEVTDSWDYGPCVTTTIIQVSEPSLPLPRWREISPF